MRQSGEKTAALPHGITLSYDTFGDPGGEPLLLIMGLGGPLTWWHSGLCELLADRGFHAIRYDNRDVGRSTKLTGLGGTRRAIVGAYTRVSRPPYTLSDMAADGLALLDHLGIDRAHVTGTSMGGMIAQTMAIEHPDRVRSLVSIMSTTGKRSVGWADLRLLPIILSKRSQDRDEVIERSVHTWRAIGSPAYPTPPDVTRARAAQTYDRGLDAAGAARQLQAIGAQRDRTRALGRLRLPAMVIHGLNDPLIHVSGGRATARAIPGAELLLIPGMGHDLPEELWPTFADGIARTAARAGASVSAR